MRKTFYWMLTVLALTATACGCNKNDGSIPDNWPWTDPDADDKPWEEVTDGRFGALPDYIKVYHSPEVLKGRKAEAWIATADLSRAQFHVWGLNDPELDGSREDVRGGGQVDSHHFV